MEYMEYDGCCCVQKSRKLNPILYRTNPLLILQSYLLINQQTPRGYSHLDKTISLSQ
jgi:hypothetical protein